MAHHALTCKLHKDRTAAHQEPDRGERTDLVLSLLFLNPVFFVWLVIVRTSLALTSVEASALHDAHENIKKVIQNGTFPELRVYILS
jgi:hypothetical protein